MNDFRAWVSHATHYEHYVGHIARDMKQSGWMGCTPESLRAWLATNSYPADLVQEVDALEAFFKAFQKRSGLA